MTGDFLYSKSQLEKLPAPVTSTAPRPSSNSNGNVREKDSVLTSPPVRSEETRTRRRTTVDANRLYQSTAPVIVVLLILYLLFGTHIPSSYLSSPSSSGYEQIMGKGDSGQEHDELEVTGAGVCPQTGTVAPIKNAALYQSFSEELETDAFKTRAIEALAGCVREPTESYDDQGPPGTDPRWKTFDGLHDYLKAAFPLVFTKLDVTTINTYGLVFHWQGSNSELKPVLLAGHQDVVPVDPKTLDQWEYPPYSGHFDGESIWGRGSADDKSALAGILTVLEMLLQKGFRPTRSIVAAFGFDEECSGGYGARTIAPFLENKFGRDGFAFIIDEGGAFREKYGADFSTPAIAEKGYLDMSVRVQSPGGHSSIPPAHTTIGILSALLVHYENHPAPFTLDRVNPVYGMLQCFAAHGPTMEAELASQIIRSVTSDKALRRLSEALDNNELGAAMRSLTMTTQAIDVITGGIKSNALPEEATAIVNHRISVMSNLTEVIEHSESVLRDLGRDFNLTYTSFGEKLSAGPSRGSLVTSDAWGTGLEPAPISPTNSAPFRLLAGTIKTVYNAHRGVEEGEKSVIVAPGMMNGNTDTRYYWNLSTHIYRYNHRYSGTEEKTPGLHTVNEHIPLSAYLEMIRFFATLILNVDEAIL